MTQAETIRDDGGQVSPVCCVCHGPVNCWRDEAPQEAVCVGCCEGVEHSDGETGHVFEYERSERDWMCKHCGSFPTADFISYLNSLGEP
jgi:hypothetical protein